MAITFNKILYNIKILFLKEILRKESHIFVKVFIVKTGFICYTIIIMEEKFFEKLEFNKIREIVSNYAITFLGKDMALSLFPLKNKQEIEKALKQNFEAETLIYRKGNLPIFEIQNIKPYLKNIESQNVLSCKQLLELADILRLSNNLKKYFLSTEIDMTEFTALSRVI